MVNITIKIRMRLRRRRSNKRTVLTDKQNLKEIEETAFQP